MVMTDVLLIDDDIELCSMLSEFLEREGMSVRSVHNGKAGTEQALTASSDLIILDVMLPQGNGLDVLREIRQSQNTPVIMLTARGDEVDRVLGLELGADDYLPKPFSPRELLARIRAILRRTDPGMPIDKFSVGTLAIDPGKRELSHAGEPIVLTSTEFTIIHHLMHRAGQVVSKELLSEQALGRKLARYDRSIDMHIAAIRKKLGDSASLIKTVRGVGYQLVD